MTPETSLNSGLEEVTYSHALQQPSYLESGFEFLLHQLEKSLAGLPSSVPSGCR